jgi:hypothetical protein
MNFSPGLQRDNARGGALFRFGFVAEFTAEPTTGCDRNSAFRHGW